MTISVTALLTKAKYNHDIQLQPEHMETIKNKLLPEVQRESDYAFSHANTVTDISVDGHDLTVEFNSTIDISPLIINLELRPVMSRPLVITIDGKNTKVSRANGLVINVLRGLLRHIEANRDRLKQEKLNRLRENVQRDKDFVAKIKRSNTGEIMKLIESGDINQRMLIAEHGDDNVRMLLVSDTSDSVRRTVAEFGNPALRSLLLNDKSTFVLATIARFGNDTQREHLLRSDDEFVRAELAHFGSEHIQWLLLHDKSEDVRANIVLYGTDEHRKRLRLDSNSTVKDAFDEFKNEG